MGEVNLDIHGKTYGVHCDEGQEDRVAEVGQYVNARAGDIASAGAASNETHLLVLTSLVLADEIKELRDSLQAQAANVNGQARESASIAKDGVEEQQVVAAIDQLVGRLDSVTERLLSA